MIWSIMRKTRNLYHLFLSFYLWMYFSQPYLFIYLCSIVFIFVLSTRKGVTHTKRCLYLYLFSFFLQSIWVQFVMRFAVVIVRIVVVFTCFFFFQTHKAPQCNKRVCMRFQRCKVYQYMYQSVSGVCVFYISDCVSGCVCVFVCEFFSLLYWRKFGLVNRA